MDLVVRNARVEGHAYPVDIGIDEGIVVEVGEHLSGRGSDELDAGGRLLTAGFVNIHLHLDKCLSGAWKEVWE